MAVERRERHGRSPRCRDGRPALSRQGWHLFADLIIDGHRETWPLRSKRFQAWVAPAIPTDGGSPRILRSGSAAPPACEIVVAGEVGERRVRAGLSAAGLGASQVRSMPGRSFSTGSRISSPPILPTALSY